MADPLSTHDPSSPPPRTSARFVSAILPLFLACVGLAIAALLSVIAYGAWHVHKADNLAEEARARVHVGMTVGEVRTAVEDLGSFALGDQGSAPSWGQIQVWSGGVGYSVIVRFDSSGKVVTTEAPHYLD